MRDYISRRDAVEVIYKALRTPLPDYRKNPFYCSMDVAMAMANEIPDADVRENEHGHWIYVGNNDYKCSECGFVMKTTPEYAKEHFFCWKCGADMRK